MVGCLVLLGMIFTEVFSKCLKKARILGDDDEEIIVDEKLGTYFECMSVWDRKQWLATEVHNR